jgi:hypothetical protein
MRLRQRSRSKTSAGARHEKEAQENSKTPEKKGEVGIFKDEGRRNSSALRQFHLRFF